MTERVHVNIELELFVDDEPALRHAAYERLSDAWSAEEAFPYDSADGVPIDEVIASELGSALPISFHGARRSAISVEAESRGAVEDEEQSSEQTPDESDGNEDEGEDTASQASATERD